MSRTYKKHLCLWLVATALCSAIAPFAYGQIDEIAHARELAESLVRAKTPEERTRLLTSHKQLITVALRRALIIEGNTFLAEGKYADAIATYDTAKSIAEQIGDKAGVGAALLNTGTVFYLQGNLEKAVESYQAARQIFVETKDQAELGRVLMGIGMVRKDQGKSSEALGFLQQALRELEAQGTTANAEDLTEVLNLIGSIYESQGNRSEAIKTFDRSLMRNNDPASSLRIGNAHYSQGNILHALEYFEKASKLLETTPNRSEPAVMIALLGSLANVYYRLGNYELSLKHYQKNLPIQERMGDKSGLALTLEGIGNVYRQQGEFGPALESYMASLQRASESGDKVSTATTLGSIGLIRAAQGNNDEALKYYRMSLEEFERRGDKVGTARALVNIGNSSYMSGKYDQALEAFQKALTIREGIDDKSDIPEILLGIGTTYAAQSNLSAALENHRKALAIFEKHNDKDGVARALKEIASCYAIQGNFTEALTFITRAATIAAETDSYDLQWRTNFDKGKYNQSLNRIPEARQSFETAVRKLEELQAQPCRSQDQTTPQSVIAPYGELVRLLIDENKTEEALLYVERGKTQELRSIMRGAELRIRKTLTDQESENERRFFSSLAALNLEIQREQRKAQQDEDVLKNLNDRRQQTRQGCEDFRKNLYVRHPQLRLYRGEIGTLANVTAASGFLADGKTAFVEFLVTDDTTYVFVLTRETSAPRARTGRVNRPTLRLQVYPVQLQRRDLSERIARFRTSILKQDEGFAQLARELYELLLKPAEQSLQNASAILISPDRELWALPFQALQPAENEYLIERSAIAYTPSLATYQVMSKAAVARTARPQRPAGVIVFSNPTIDERSLRRIELINGSASLVTVNNQGEGAKNYTGADAREESVKSELPKRNVLNLATSAFIDDITPLSSFTVFARQSDSGEDGLLYAGETMQLTSGAPLVMLPFASIARGPMEIGDGVLGVTWSWFVAGTPALLISQWPGDADHTMKLLGEFQSRRSPGARVLKVQVSNASALQSAIKSHLQSTEFRHPYYWAGLRLFG